MIASISGGYCPWDNFFHIQLRRRHNGLQRNIVEMTLRTFASKRLGLHRIYVKINGVVTCDKKNLRWFVVEYIFYPTRCMFSIPSPRFGHWKHTINSLAKNHIQLQTIGDPIFITCMPLYPMDITHGINFSHTTAMTSQWIITQYCWKDVRNFCI